MKPYARVFELSFAGFFAALHLFLVAYIHSSVISERLGADLIAPIFAVGSALAVLSFFAAPRLLSRFGARAFLTTVALCEGIALLTLASFTGVLPTLAALLSHLVFFPLIGFALDIFLEQATTEESRTGSSRGIFLTATNTALVLSPFIMGAILARGSFEGVYFFSLFMFILFLLAMLIPYQHFKEGAYGRTSVSGMRAAYLCADIAPTALAHLTLRIFYAWAAIYIPLYLVSVGFSWPEIGLMLGVALLPFALVELPLGKIADALFGEKELMITGFLILAGSLSLLSLSLPLDIVLYTALLFMTRLGAAFVEIATETHFFRAVSSKDTNSITFFRMLQPLGYVLGVTLGAIVLSFLPLQEAFLAFGILLLFGIPCAARITDSR